LGVSTGSTLPGFCVLVMSRCICFPFLEGFKPRAGRMSTGLPGASNPDSWNLEACNVRCSAGDCRGDDDGQHKRQLEQRSIPLYAHQEWLHDITPFLSAFRFCGLPKLLNNKGVGLTKLLPRIEVGKISKNFFYTEGRMVALVLMWQTLYNRRWES
jgi:hypothetical protein